MPEKRSENGVWPHPGRLPLGAGWEGRCTAPGHEGAVPELAHLQGGCNLGYASQCPRLPADRAWDSVRFSIAREEGTQVTLVFVCERAHRPAGHGRLRFELATGTWIDSHTDARIQRMAECFLQSHLARTGRRPALLSLPL